MNLASVFTNALAMMDGVTKTVQETVRVRPWIGEDTYGRIQRGATRKLKCVVDRNKREVRTRDGRTLQCTAMLTFIKPFPAVGAVGREEPIDPRDEIFLQNEDNSGPIISIQGSINPGTGERYFLKVALG